MNLGKEVKSAFLLRFVTAQVLEIFISDKSLVLHFEQALVYFVSYFLSGIMVYFLVKHWVR